MRAHSYVVAISGYREFNDYKTFDRILRAVFLKRGFPSEMISGECSGTDQMAEKWSIENGIPYCKYAANWNKFGQRAGPIRNKILINNADLLIAFPAPKSKGTRNAIKLAKKKGICVDVFEISSLT